MKVAAYNDVIMGRACAYGWRETTPGELRLFLEEAEAAHDVALAAADGDEDAVGGEIFNLEAARDAVAYLEDKRRVFRAFPDGEAVPVFMVDLPVDYDSPRERQLAAVRGK